MKKLSIAIASGLAALQAYGQGIVNFNNRVTGLIDARVMLPDGTGAAGIGWVAQLYGGPPDGRLTPLTPPTTFRTTSAAAMGYINAVNLVIPGVPPEQEATVIMRAFKGTSWETATLRGESNPVTITVGGGLNPPANLIGLTGFRAVPALAPPMITRHPGSQLAAPGSSVLFKVEATSESTLRYRWMLEGVNIPGAISATLVLNNVTPADEGRYVVVVSNDYGAVSSASARLTIETEPSVITRTLPALFVPGESVTVEISAKLSPQASAYTVQDQVPPGWTVTQVSHQGFFSSTTRLVRWGPFSDGQPRDLSYTVRSSADSPASVQFDGFGSFSGRDYPITGSQQSRASSRIAAIRLVGDQGFVGLQFTINGRVGAKYDVEVSSNLLDWTWAGVAAEVNGAWGFRDFGVTVQSALFYRAVER